MKKTLYINDTNFSHAPSSSWYNVPENFEWSRVILEDTDNIILTNLYNHSLFPNKKLYGWVIEPPSINKSQYDFAEQNYDKFVKIFTYDKELLSKSSQFEFLPICGCWIEESDRKIHSKNKMICSISSSKSNTDGHKLRHIINSKFPTIDAFGHGYKSIEKKIEVLKDYRFSVVVENQKMDYLFTEKIIDCFLTGTIPIYYGCPSIGDFFDTRGFFTFDSIEELDSIIEKLDENLYSSLLNYVEINFNKSLNYIMADEIIFKKFEEWKIV